MSKWRDFLLGHGHDLDDVKIGVRTKLDGANHDELEEWANKLTDGNLSGATRIAIVLGMDRLTELYEGKIPSVAIANRGRRKWIKEQAAQQRLQRGAIELKQHYTKEYEEAMKKYAEEEGLDWPPSQIDLKEIDPTIKRVMERLSTVLDEKTTATLRDVYSGLSGLGASEARDAVIKLEELGVVALAGSRQTYGTLEIKWAELEASA